MAVMAREIKFNGRELAMMRAIGFGLGTSGSELQERLNVSAEELVDLLNTLLDMGFIETTTMKEAVTVADFGDENFEINPSYASDVREAMKRR